MILISLLVQFIYKNVTLYMIISHYPLKIVDVVFEKNFKMDSNKCHLFS